MTEYINTILAGPRRCGSDEFCDNCPAKEKAALYDEVVADALQLKQERDAAVHALKENRRCETCRHYIPGYFCPGCRNLDKWESRYV